MTDKQLTAAQGGLGCMALPNPNNPKHGDMKLYLRSQCEALALETWGSEAGLFEERERRSAERLLKAAARKRKAENPGFRDRHRGLPSGRSKAGKAGGGGGGGPSWAPTTRHEHTFLKEETFDEATNQWTRRCACGFEESYEVF